MTTTREQVSQWLQLALQQLAAEAYFHELPADLERREPELIRRLKYAFNDPLHPYIEAWVQKEADRAGVPNQVCQFSKSDPCQITSTGNTRDVNRARSAVVDGSKADGRLKCKRVHGRLASSICHEEAGRKGWLAAGV